MTPARVENQYRLYLDESRDHVIYDESTLQEPSHRYLALLGCWFPPSTYVPFFETLEKFKYKHLPRDPDDPVVILHRKDIVNRRGPFWRLRDDRARAAFDNDLLAVTEEADFTIVVVIVDKLKLKHQYVDPQHPYHLAVLFMLQRFCYVLNHFNRQGYVVAESRGGREDRLLQSAYYDVIMGGDWHHDASFFQRALVSDKVKFNPKAANIAGLQLADILAHPVKQQVLADRGAPGVFVSSVGRKVADIAARKFNKNLWTRRVEGYGWVLFPK